MTVRTAIAVIVVGALGVVAAYIATFAGAINVAAWAMAAGGVLVLTGLGLLGVGENRPRLAAAVLVACSFTFAGFATGLLLGTPSADGALLLGLPRASALLLMLAGAVPLLLLPIAYAIAFEPEVMRDE